ncbi:MAG: HAD-IC family P-type ATPase, partial [Acidobacteria bacterium]|nr:HAD-IC family P-type ATPase [Acidobacteriota bacterium]
MNASNQSTAAVFAALKSSPAGLGRAEIEKRRAEFGPNELQEKEKNPPWRVFLAQFKDFMILVLAAAAIVSGAIGELTDTIVIFVIVVLNAVIGFVQEYRAEKTLAALKKMTVTKTPVVRENRTTVVSSTELVPGDVVELEAGAVVPADLRLFEVYALRVDESSLTGESVPVDKTGAALALEENAAPADRTNIAFKGTLVTSGRARGVAVATGMRTELGRIAGLLQENEAATPLQRRMAQFGRNLSYIILLICLVLFLTGVLRGEDPFEILLVSISLAVAAIPEALP